EMLTRVVNEHHVRTVIDLGADPVGSEHDTAVAGTLAGLGVKRIRMDLSGDGTGNPNCYVRALREMADPANHPLLIQCGAGAQRTGVACALYENIIRSVPLDAALDHAEQHRFSRTKDKPAMDYLAKWKDAIERAYRDGTEIEGFESMAK
ncbi:MAG TPA: tyrosine-protein phosphatase, partial [Phycisphaerales bacterium]|nr:tyrosine-protein phosphatase [Phycisphaerales bacterium]